MLAPTVFLLDVDNTLIDNDLLKGHLQGEIRAFGGEALDQRFWQVYEQVRQDLDAVSVPITLQRLRQESREPDLIDRLADRIYSTPFASFVYPGARELLSWLRRVGLPVILSDGDPWFQAKKITDAGLGAVVAGNVLIFLHKEQHVDDIRRWYPAQRYVAVDDKARLLGVLKERFGELLTTIWVRQGHYSAELVDKALLAPDHILDGIGAVRALIETQLGD